MPPRVNLTILLGFVVAIVFTFGLSAGAQPDEGEQGDGAGGVEPGVDSAGASPEEDEIGEARRELERLQWEVQAAHGARLNADEEKRQAADDIAATQNELAEAEEHSAEAGKDLADTASEVYRTRGIDDILGVLVGAGSLGDFADRLNLAARLLVHKQDAVEEANQAEEELSSELQERQGHLQRWEETGAEEEAEEERVRQAEADVQAYLDSLDEGVREGIEGERAQQAELDQARGAEVLRKLEEDQPATAAPSQVLPPVQNAVEQLGELRSVEQNTEERAVEKVVEAEQARLAAEQEAAEKGEAPEAVEPKVGGPAALLRIERAGSAPELAPTEAGQAVSEAERAATEAAKQAQAAEQARRVAERDAAAKAAAEAAADRAKLQEAAKKAEERQAELPIEVSNDTDGAVNGGDRLRVKGDFSIQPGATVTFGDPDGTTGMAIDGLNADIRVGSIDTTMTGPLENVTGGDGTLDAAGGLEVVDTTGIIDADLAIELVGQDATGAGLQYDPTLGAAGLQYDPTLGAAGLQYAPTTGTAGLPYAPVGTTGAQYDPTLGATGLQYGLAVEPMGLKSDPIVGDAGLKSDPIAGATTGTTGQPKAPAVSGQPGLQPAASVPATGAPATGAPAVGRASGSAIVREAMGWLGTPYSYGGTSRSGISCSGLVMMAYQPFGISLPNSPEGQLGVVGPLKKGPAPAGAIVFFAESGSGPTHVGISNGDGTMTDANIVKGQVGITPIDIVTGYMGWGFPPGF
jgi:cell wall-associated NlpC family hydrolase/peptidoglycan hydrolase CwlO-like protein